MQSKIATNSGRKCRPSSSSDPSSPTTIQDEDGEEGAEDEEVGKSAADEKGQDDEVYEVETEIHCIYNLLSEKFSIIEEKLTDADMKTTMAKAWELLEQVEKVGAIKVDLVGLFPIPAIRSLNGVGLFPIPAIRSLVGLFPIPAIRSLVGLFPISALRSLVGLFPIPAIRSLVGLFPIPAKRGTMAELVPC